jgi:hypothetical protein
MFDPIRIYDKPAVILTQLGNGIATTDSVRRAMFEPAALSPRERASYVDELKKSTGGNPIVDTALDVLGNPLTWLAFVAGGAMASKNFARTGRFFTGGIQHAGYGEWGKTRWPFLRFFRAMSASHLAASYSRCIGGSLNSRGFISSTDSHPAAPREEDSSRDAGGGLQLSFTL